MGKVLNVTFLAIINYSFTVMTGYCYLDVIKTVLPFIENGNIEGLKLKASIVVVIVTGVYWLIRLCGALMDLPYKRRERKMKEEILKLKHEAEVRKITKEHLNDAYEQLKKT